jgi:tetratricopeptide (TPR) repeat protein
LTPAQLDQGLRDFWRNIYDFVTVRTARYDYDKTNAELKLSMTGEAKLEWDDGWLYVPGSELAYEPDLERAPGPNREAPWAIAFPSYERARVTIRLPAGFAPNRSKSLSPVREILAGVEYVRSADFKDGVFIMEKTERSLRPEVSHSDAVAAAARLKALADEDVYLRVPSTYRVTEKDLQSKAAEKPSSADAFVERGLVYLDRGKYDEAIADFSEAIKLDPKDVWALANRGLTYAWKRDFKSAERDLFAAEAIEKDNKVMLRGRGLAAEFKGDFAGSVTIYDRILTLASDDSWTRLRRALIRMMQGKREDALRDIDTVIAADPYNSSALAQRAYIMASKEDWAAAEKDVAAALKANPGNAIALATKATIAKEHKDYKAALDLVSQALSHDPDNYYALSLQAQLLKREGGEESAMRVYDQAVARAPTDTNALLSRAFAHLEAKNFEAAEKDVVAALAIEPADPRALQVRGSVAMARGDYKAAVEALTAALKAAPLSAPVLIQRAGAYQQLGELGQALADTEAALKAGFASPELRLQRINILVQDGDLAAAGAEADKLLQENPTSEFAMVAAGKSYSAMGMTKKAMESFDRALAINPVPYIYINRSQVRPFTDLQGKLDDLDAALKIDPKNEQSLTEKARILSKAGRHAEAIELYDQAIKSALDSKSLQLDRAIALERAGRTAEAARAFEAEQTRAKTAGDFNRLCWSKAVNDVALPSAVSDCRAALRLDPEHRGVNDSLGMALLKLGKLPDALAAYDKAVAKKPGATSYMGRAIVKARLGDASGARADAAEARKRRPDVDDMFAEYGLKTEAEPNLASQ